MPLSVNIAGNTTTNMTREIQIPTGVQFAYINIKLDSEEILTPEMIEESVSDYKRLLGANNGTTDPIGLPNKEFNAIYDELRVTGKVKGDPGTIGESMSLEQKKAINELKKSIKRGQIIE